MALIEQSSHQFSHIQSASMSPSVLKINQFSLSAPQIVPEGTHLQGRVSKNGESFMKALMHGDRSMVKMMTLLLPSLIPAIQSKGGLPLHIAVENDDYKMVELLLSLPNIHLNQQDRERNTPLHLAAIRGDYLSATELAKAGSDVSLKNRNGDNVLHMAAYNGNVDLFESLYLYYARNFSSEKAKAALQASNALGQDPVHIAHQRNNAPLEKVISHLLR